jgi:two-component system, OmpR family, phosphate regulon sensor histidine kinase PhoR
MRMNILLRHFIYYALIIVFTTLIITIIASREYKKNYLNTLELSLQKQAEIIGVDIKDLALNGQYSQVNTIINEIAKKNNTRITVIRIDGQVIGESDQDIKTMEDHSSRPEFIQAIKSGFGRQIRYSETTKREMMYIAIPLLQNNKPIVVIRTSAYLSEIQKTISAVNKKIINSAIVLTILALLLAVLSSRNLTKPIRVITSVAERIKKGEFDSRIVLKRKDEIGRLSSSINEMAESLNELFSTLKAEREEIKSILSSMAEGLIVLDEKEKIALANDNFKAIVGFAEDNIQGKYYWEVIKNMQFSDLVKEIKETGIRQNKEIELNNKLYSANGGLALQAKDRKTIIVLHDITEIKNTERIKSDFIANVSHELKTPLTSIKGFAETLEQESGKKYKKFAETIRRNADRLINIVQDLLVISELERKEEKIQIEQINLKEMFNNIKKLFSAKLKIKKLKYQVTISDEVNILNGDPFLIEQMLTNLIDNAIKYNVEEGKIIVTASKIDNNIKIIVEDTGIGIGQEHLSRIFERFYVVDKSRSRRLGGTGLGLSIVKHIVLSHNGKIEVESEVGKGTRFIITLPQSA